MACLCEQIAGKDIDLSPICIGHLWIFENLDPKDIEALSRDALRKKSVKAPDAKASDFGYSRVEDQNEVWSEATRIGRLIGERLGTPVKGQNAI